MVKESDQYLEGPEAQRGDWGTGVIGETRVKKCKKEREELLLLTFFCTRLMRASLTSFHCHSRECAWMTTDNLKRSHSTPAKFGLVQVCRTYGTTPSTLNQLLNRTGWFPAGPPHGMLQIDKKKRCIFFFFLVQ
jgi:hypothetical protein